MDLSLSNPFAALEVRKAKKKKPDSGGRKKRETAKSEQNYRLEQEIFGTERKESNISWADDDGEWGADPVEVTSKGDSIREAETRVSRELTSQMEIDLEEHFGVELGPEDDHEEQEEKNKETTAEPSAEELTLLEEHRKKYHARPERKVSKKELKKKEMDDLDDLLADFGIDVNEQKGQESSNKKKKKRNKEKGTSFGEEQPASPEATEPTIEAPTEVQSQPPDEKEGTSALTSEEIKIRLEKSKSTKKKQVAKKSIEIAAAEAKARSKGKKGKKDATHYNQVLEPCPGFGHRMGVGTQSLSQEGTMRDCVFLSMQECLMDRVICINDNRNASSTVTVM